MKKVNKLMWSLMVFFIFQACGIPIDCRDHLGITNLEREYGCVNTKYQMNISDDFLKISTQSDFESLVTGSCSVEVDFLTYDLIIGKVRLGTYNNSIEYVLTESCTSENLELVVNFKQSNTPSISELVYHTLIPKFYNDLVLDVKINLEVTNEQCANPILYTTSLEEEYDCVNTKDNVDIDLVDTFTVIETQEEYDSLVSGNCDVVIDFLTYDLLIGEKTLTNGNASIDYQLEENCANGNRVLKVTFLQNSTTEAPNLTYHVLMPKLYAQTISVEIDVVN